MVDGDSASELIRCKANIKEDEKQRTQIFEGIVISIKGHQPNSSFTVRKIATGSVGVEMIWPILSPAIAKIEVKKKGDVRRSKLYYLRKRIGKRAVKVKEKKETKKKKKDEKKEPGKPRRKSRTKKASK